MLFLVTIIAEDGVWLDLYTNCNINVSTNEGIVLQ